MLVTDRGSLIDSEDIVAFADPSLRQADPEVARITRWLDANLGIPDRRLIYAHILPHKDVLLGFNNVGVPPWEAQAMTAFWAVLHPWAVQQLGLGGDIKQRDEALTLHAFTAADLTFAALASPMVGPPEYGTPLPQPGTLPDETAAMIARFREHPAGEFALRLYREERPVPPQPWR